MAIDEIAKLIGAAIAGGAASFAGLAKVPERVKAGIASDESVALLRQRLDALTRQHDELRDTVKRLEERSAHFVSDEEFSTYTTQTSAAVTALTEKVGHATGAIEAWYRSQPGRNQGSR